MNSRQVVAHEAKLLTPISQWDTANIYSNGDSERVIAQAIKTYKIPRHKLVLMSKAYSCVGEEQFHAYHILGDLVRSKDYVNQFGKYEASKPIPHLGEGGETMATRMRLT